MKFLRTLLILLLIQFKAYALIEVDITRGNLSPLPVAVSPLSSDKKSLVEVEKILKALGVSELNILGYSNGGTVAYRLAAFSNLKIKKMLFMTYLMIQDN